MEGEPINDNTSIHPDERMAPAHQGEVKLIPQPHGGALYPPMKRGETLNPAGRPNAGAAVIEHFNAIGRKHLSEVEIERIAKDSRNTPVKRAAALRWLNILSGQADLSDFDQYINDGASLKELKRAGISVRRVKRARQRTISREDGGTETQREIELDQSPSEELERLIDRTHGKAMQRQEISGPGGGAIRIEAAALALLAPADLEALERILSKLPGQEQTTTEVDGSRSGD